MCAGYISFCQSKNDLTLNRCLEEIKNVKFDSVDKIEEIPTFIAKGLKSKCGKRFRVLSDKDYRRKFKRNPFRTDLYRFEFGMKTTDYYLVQLWKDGDLFSTGYLAIFKFEENKVIASHILTGFFSEPMKGVINMLNRNAWTSADDCE
jgi:hypothetical protein